MAEANEKNYIKTYTIGFLLSLLLTFLAYGVVTSGAISPAYAVALIILFAIVQLFVQLVFFLHLGSEASPRWRLVTLAFGVLVVAIVVFGSLWIMDNLNYNMMHSSSETEKYIDRQGGF
jgi:cytochrome o ubiquinol oxidase operon protein cyoD